MRMPIQYALTYPERVPSNQVALDWRKLQRLDFAKGFHTAFPLPSTGSRSGEEGQGIALLCAQCGG